MIRQQSSRNQRIKGRRMKNILKICVMVVICFWLLYQLRHSYNKKKALDERSSKNLIYVADSELDLSKFGRKEMPQREETQSGHETFNEDDNKEETEEEDQEVKEAIEDLDRGGLEDDEIDVQDHDRDDEQDVQEGDDEEAANGDELANDEDKKDHDDNAEELELLDDKDHEDGSRDTPEESYKKNEASSDVQQEGQETKTKGENGSMHSKFKKIIEEKVADKDDVPKVKGQLKNNSASIVAGARGINETILSNDLSIIDGAIERQGPEVWYNRDDRSEPDNQVVPQVNSTASSWFENQKLQTENISIQRGSHNDEPVENQKTVSNLRSPKEIKHALDNWTSEQTEKANNTFRPQNLEEHSRRMNENNVKRKVY